MPHRRIRSTISYNMLQANDKCYKLMKPFTSCSQACCRLAKYWLAYAILVFYKLATNLLQAVSFK